MGAEPMDLPLCMSLNKVIPNLQDWGSEQRLVRICLHWLSTMASLCKAQKRRAAGLSFVCTILMAMQSTWWPNNFGPTPKTYPSIFRSIQPRSGADSEVQFDFRRAPLMFIG
ncbi:MAG: hypothetical protein BGO51_12780 [Rhodospirillales bacterium 69-11]|nr:MAG: hypothetical protein BGO51_12780 [Rhodospirillales bacterium 69-11]